MKYRSWFQCINCEDQHYPLNEVLYQCTNDGGLLEVRHDMDALCQTPSHEWMKLFDQRFMRTGFPYGSSVWGKKEVVCPEIDNANIVSMFEGGSNLFWAERLGREIGLDDLWVKQCGNSHTGSFKDLGMTVLVSMVKHLRSKGQAIPAMVCASTGDTSAALAAYGAAAGIPTIVLLPHEKVTLSQLIQPIANGALTISLKTDFDGCMKYAQELARKENIYLANSMNPLRIEGQKTVAMELVQQQDWKVPDWVIIPGGNLGNVSALGKGFGEMKEMGMIDRLPRIAVAQAATANPLYLSYLEDYNDFKPQKARDTLATAIRIGNPVSMERAVRTLKKFNGVVEQASEDELANASARADKTGLFTCPHTGVALAALFKLVDKKVIASDSNVVVLSTAHGLKFPDFKVNYHEDKLREQYGVIPKHMNDLIVVDDEYDQVRSAVLRSVDKTGLN